MKIGLVIFGIYPSGLKQLIHHVVANRAIHHQYIGIEIEREHQQEVHFKSIEYDEVNGSQKLLLKASSVTSHAKLFEEMTDLDALIVMGTASTKAFIEGLQKDSAVPKLLFVPISILNDISGSDSTLGYDTALNSIVEGALKIQDTIASVKYDKPRLFGVQVPGKAPDRMLEELAVAAEGYYVSVNFSEDRLQQICDEIQSNFSNDKTSTVLFYNEEFSPEGMDEQVLAKLNVDWKAMKMDEALCMGSHPTANDRILASKLAGQINLWLINNLESGELIVRNTGVEYLQL